MGTLTRCSETDCLRGAKENDGFVWLAIFIFSLYMVWGLKLDSMILILSRIFIDIITVYQRDFYKSFSY